MKKVFTIIGSVIAILIVVVLIIGFFFWYAFGGSVYFTQIPKPEITYGEFPISVTYEVDGETRIIEDTVICEFDGFEMRGESGKYRKWKSYLKNEDNKFGFLPIGKDGLAFEVGIFIGSPNYYMGDFEQSKDEYERVMADDIYMEYVEWKNDVKTGRSFTKEEVWEMYNLKILDIKYSQPIQNSFK